MFLSLRAALERWPRQLRCFALALALLAWVAPTWHICELGGHALAGCATASPSHHERFLLTAAAGDGSGQRAFICYCPPRAKDKAHTASQVVLTATPHQGEHPTCLAMLLQNLPGVVSQTQTFSEVFVSRPAQFATLSFSLPRRQILQRRGRAPPVEL